MQTQMRAAPMLMPRGSVPRINLNTDMTNPLHAWRQFDVTLQSAQRKRPTVSLNVMCGTASISDSVEEWFRNETETVRPAGASTKLFAGDFALLNFQPTDRPAWRQCHALPSTCTMLQDIQMWMLQYKRAEPAALIESASITLLTARFIYFNNKAEGTGLADELSTRTLLEEGSADLPDRKLREVLQMHTSMTYLEDIREERLRQGASLIESILLTSESVLQAHRKLTVGLIDRPGKLRNEHTYAGTPGGGKFYYDPPQLVSCSLDVIIELYNALLSDLTDEQDSPNFSRKLFNLAALLFVKLVTVHPFEDGNGRLCRLLVNHVLSAVTPFPVPLYVEDGVRSHRTYVSAIMAARDMSDAKLTRIVSPNDLSALSIDSAWQTWRALFSKSED